MSGIEADETDLDAHRPWFISGIGVRCSCADQDDYTAHLAEVIAPLLEEAAAEDVYAEVKAERERAHAKHGDTSMESAPADDPTGRRYRILCEEVGEVAKEFNDAEHDQRPVDLALVRKELIQVAAMAAAWADVCGTAPDDEGSAT